ncbi:class I SAM-dependent methyltransferase [Candidatus Scalindua japonica]|nr:class I SAM-dependent methyltransferase [Candidatus Scalindua japonica]
MVWKVDTTKKIDRRVLDIPDREFTWSYEACGVRRFHRIMKRINIDHTKYNFIDIGSGKGRVLLMSIRYNFRRIVGVEFSKKLHETAKRNIENYSKKLGKKECIELFNCNALEFHFPIEPSIIFLFNPFKRAIMERFITNLQQSLTVSPRSVLVVYVHPTEKALLEKTVLLSKTYEDCGRDDFVIFSNR